MGLQPGWYKVKLLGAWDCAYYDGDNFSIIESWRSIVLYKEEDLDEIGDRINLPDD